MQTQSTQLSLETNRGNEPSINLSASGTPIPTVTKALSAAGAVTCSSLLPQAGALAATPSECEVRRAWFPAVVISEKRHVQESLLTANWVALKGTTQWLELQSLVVESRPWPSSQSSLYVVPSRREGGSHLPPTFFLQ